MSKTHDTIGPELAAWIAEQKVFFVGSAPMSPDGHVNISPKGGEAFRILGPREAAYQDYTGSGAETVAHLRENGRIVVMFCAFSGPPKIVRLHGAGTVIHPGSPRFAELQACFPANPGTRAIIHISVRRISDSCGFSVPCFDYRGPRDILDNWAAAQGPEKIGAYWAKKNAVSIDGLPALPGQE
ncbi:MAG TPA: pyridoxamine 5'-phosphate oxidase family protein [Terrimicrobiaceae bacterium]|nr:pyridoxamine 5'-phosphate oxidase family protein [Terrimicrobiaceae bacterium]